MRKGLIPEASDPSGVDRAVADLLVAIKREQVPDSILTLAQRLQAELDARQTRPSQEP